MKEIKFKGKRSDNGNWIYGDLILSDSIFKISTLEYVYGPLVEIPCAVNYEVDIISQYTGNVDKNGREIYYDVDIIKIDGFSGEWIASRDQFDIPAFLELNGPGTITFQDLGEMYDNFPQRLEVLREVEDEK